MQSLCALRIFNELNICYKMMKCYIFQIKGQQIHACFNINKLQIPTNLNYIYYGRQFSNYKNSSLGKYLTYVTQIIYYKREIENSFCATDFERIS